MNLQPDAREAERNLLAVEALARRGLLRLRVLGESMLPTLWPGDEVEIARASPAEIRRGEVVLTFYESRFFLHRTWKFSENGGVVTRGDSMSKPDPALPAQAIVGRLKRVTRAGGTFPVSPRGVAIRRALGLVFCHAGLLRRMALRLHRWRMKRIEIAESRQNLAPPQFHFGNPSSGLCNRESQ